MELKSYQRKALNDLSAYLDAVSETQNLRKAWEQFWNDKDIAVGWNGRPEYQYTIPHVPHVCMKVPTGGGKTFLACSSLRPIFSHFPQDKPKVVIWLVPSDSILTQTVRTLSDPEHPYRQRLDRDFSGRVGVYTKDQLLNGQNFSPDTIRELLTVCVLSYASLRIDSKKKDVRKAYQENGNLMRFAEYFRDQELLLADTPDTALMQVLCALSPVVVVDESHNAGSKLSVEMLRNLNPSMILELTATPRKSSNILCYTDARELKRENMVKLPVIVYNRMTRDSVIQDAIRLRGNLEQQAIAEHQSGGAYIRPIVLFQAQPKINEDSETFEKIRNMLIEIGIPKEQIAVKTSNVDDLGKTDLLREDCPIRYIITVNALKEGWDCPFAYILASLANKSSNVDVEQILGRILRQPYAREHKATLLNSSFVLTCSKNFQETLDNIVKALNQSGFSREDYRLTEETGETENLPNDPSLSDQSKPQPKIDEEAETYEMEDIHPDEIKTSLEQSKGTVEEHSENTQDDLQVMISSAERQVTNYTLTVNETGKEEPPNGIEGSPVHHYKIQRIFREEAKGLLIPQFIIPKQFDLFGGDDLLEPEQLSDGFSLGGQDAQVNFQMDPGQIYSIDLAEDGEAIPKFMPTKQNVSSYIRSQMEGKAPEERIRQCARYIAQHINKNDRFAASEITEYVQRVIAGMKADDLSTMETAIPFYADKIQKKIESLEEAYRIDKFNEWLDTGFISCRPTWALPAFITPADGIESIQKSLYEAEKNDMNVFEREMVMKIAALDNVRWWHRNIDRKGFRLNGPLNHYPDFLIMTLSGTLVLVETKGDYLINDDSRTKLALGRAWQSKAGTGYRYFMVFQDVKPDWEGAYTQDGFMKIMAKL